MTARPGGGDPAVYGPPAASTCADVKASVPFLFKQWGNHDEQQACPPGGTILDPFAGGGSTALAARALGRRTVLIESREDYCQRMASRLAQGVLA